MSEKEYDLMIIGAGPAGLTAGIYGGRSGLNTLILDEEMAGGTAAEAPQIDNYPGLEEISGIELANRMRDHVAKYAELNEGFPVEDVEKNEDQIIVRGIDRDYESKAIIIANGCEYSKLGIPGEESLKGRGVSYCATCDGSAVKGESVLVVGGGNSAFSNASYLLDLGCDVTLIHKRDEFRAEEALRKSYIGKGGDIMRNYVLEEIVGDDVVESVKLRSLDDDVAENLLVKAVFISVGEEPRTGILGNLDIKLDSEGYIETDENQRTNVPRVYAAGDVTGDPKQVVNACSEGSIAATSAYKDIRNPYWVE